MSGTIFWEISGMVLSLAQMLLYLIGFNKYRKRLDSLTDELLARADGRTTAYKDLRDKDPEFYDYYKSLPDYKECKSNIMRSKGSSFADYGRQLRGSLRGINGYTQLQRVTVSGALADTPILPSAVTKTVAQISERRRVDDHVLQRWQAIVSAPTNPSHIADYGSIINSSFSSMKAFGQGVNSAGISLGSAIYRVL